MRFCPSHIVCLVLAAVVSVSCHKGPQRIPRGEMVDIFSEMFMQDQFIRYDLDIRRVADTSLVYEGIFREHGYTTDDYLYSVRYYLSDPSKMTKIMEKVTERFEALSLGMEGAVKDYEWQRKMMAIYNRPLTKRLPQPVNPLDTLRVIPDSTGSGRFYRFRPDKVREPNTLIFLLDPPVDTLTVPADTLATPADTLKTE